MMVIVIVILMLMLVVVVVVVVRFDGANLWSVSIRVVVVWAGDLRYYP